ncbi:AP-3 complex subunit mu-1 [Thelohanellus kitauei]|uniref:AP-3 complex subunit mu-1 n=1 Tax=Thelohanellus kitauei TaxID=669202 RepID=A0A0C2MMA8_THEKT|nr:AP-3 complex subunit mu-1 [Thelohanellus kitauei]
MSLARQVCLALAQLMDSLILVDLDCEIFYERHWIKDDNFSTKPIIDLMIRENKLPTTFSAGSFAYVNLLENDTYFTAVLSKETSPFYVLEVLNQVREVLESYLGPTSAKSLKSNISQVYMLIDEMFVRGHPLLNWPSLVHQIIKPKSIIDNIIKNISSNHEVVTTNTELTEPVIWRDPSELVDRNDVLLDFVETLNMIINDKNEMVCGEITGRMIANVRYSGVPTMICHFTSCSVFTSASFHPCANVARFNADRVLEFVPPNGVTEIMTYSREINDNYLPFIFTHQINRENDFKLRLTASTKQGVHNRVHQLFYFWLKPLMW